MRSNLLVALGVLYAVASAALVWTADTGDDRAFWVLTAAAATVGPPGFLEIARRVRPLRRNSALDRSRRWTGSIAMALGWPALVAIVRVRAGGHEDVVLLTGILAGSCAAIVGLVSATLAAYALVAWLLDGRPRDLG